MEDIDAEKSRHNLFEALRQLMHAPFTPWWTRIWVVQEAVLPSKVKIFYGTVSAPWQMFADAASAYAYHSEICCARFVRDIPRDYINVLQSFCRLVGDLEKMRTVFAAGAGSHNRQKSPLLPLLRQFRSRKATDPRDKVYALLGLVETEKGQLGMRPDYNLDDKDVFKNAALTSIYTSSSLSVLHADLARKYRHDLPSWVPDWEAPGDVGDNFRPDPKLFYGTCSSYLVNEGTVTASGNTLFVEAKLVDVVSRIAPPMLSEEPDSVLNTLNTWFEVVLKYLNMNWRHGQFTTNRSVEITARITGLLSRLLCAEIIAYPKAGPTRRYHPNDDIMFKTWLGKSHISPLDNSITTQTSSTKHLDEMDWHTPNERPSHITSEDTEHPWTLLGMYYTARVNNEIEILRSIFEKLFPEQMIRAKLIQDVFKERDFRDIFLDGLFIYVSESFEVHHCASIGRSYTRYPLRYEEFIDLASHSSGDPSQIISKMDTLFSAHNTSGKDPRELFRSIQLEFRKFVNWGTICKNMIDEIWHRLLTETRTELLPEHDQVSTMNHSIITATKSRRLFITEGGCLGLGPTTLKEGDKLCLIKGGATPFVLREKTPLQVWKVIDADGEVLRCYMPPNPDPDSQFQERWVNGMQEKRDLLEAYELVGDCYARGLMDSNALEQELENLWLTRQAAPSSSRSSSALRPQWELSGLV